MKAFQDMPSVILSPRTCGGLAVDLFVQVLSHIANIKIVSLAVK